MDIKDVWFIKLGLPEDYEVMKEFGIKPVWAVSHKGIHIDNTSDIEKWCERWARKKHMQDLRGI